MSNSFSDTDNTLESLYDAAAAAVDGQQGGFLPPAPVVQPMQSTPARPPRNRPTPQIAQSDHGDGGLDDINASQIPKMKKLLLDVTAHNSWLVNAVKTGKTEIASLQKTVSSLETENERLRAKVEELQSIGGGSGGLAPTTIAHQQLMEALSGIRRQLSDLRTQHAHEPDVWSEQRVLVDALNQMTTLFTNTVSRNVALAGELRKYHR